MTLVIAFHALAATIWIGGMFFAYMALRPVAASQFEPPIRLTLWSEVFKRFFPWVMVCIVTLLISGLWMISLLGGMSAVGLHVHIMLLIGVIMMLIFLHIYFNPFKKLHLSVIEKDWMTAGSALNQIRQLIAVNLLLGLVVVAVGSGGRFL